MKDDGAIPRIYADFNNCDRSGRVRLNTVGTFADLNRLGISLQEGAELMVSDSELEVEAVTTFSAEESIWVAEFNIHRLRDVRPAGDPTEGVSDH
ncbi:MAG: hypothetical protein ABSA94_16025 [Acidobacteriaceae bacterium]|jgi:hypothetical protein